MIENIELILISLLILILSIISFLPLIYLNYAKDLNNNINIYNNICDSKKNIYETDILIKNTYMWNMCSYLFDFNVIQNNFKRSVDFVKNPMDKYSDFININRDLSIVDGKINIMKVYNDYLHSGLPLFIIIWIFFILHILNIYYSTKKDIKDITKYNFNNDEANKIFESANKLKTLRQQAGRNITKKIIEALKDKEKIEYDGNPIRLDYTSDGKFLLDNNLNSIPEAWIMTVQKIYKEKKKSKQSQSNKVLFS